MKLRLLLFEKCNRKCDGCCNKQWDLTKLQQCKDFTGYEMIMLTGGEPMLYPELVKQTIKRIREQTNSPIYLYTAKSNPSNKLIEILKLIDGITLTLHDQNDVEGFVEFNKRVKKKEKSLRLNIFKGINVEHIDLEGWIVKDNIEWIKNCPLPKDEVFMRLTL